MREMHERFYDIKLTKINENFKCHDFVIYARILFKFCLINHIENNSSIATLMIMD